MAVAVKQITEAAVDGPLFASEMKPKIYLPPAVAVAVVTTQNAVVPAVEQQAKMQLFAPQMVSTEKVQLKQQVVLVDFL
jgi:hypothetical protein